MTVCFTIVMANTVSIYFSYVVIFWNIIAPKKNRFCLGFFPQFCRSATCRDPGFWQKFLTVNFSSQVCLVYIDMFHDKNQWHAAISVSWVLYPSMLKRRILRLSAFGCKIRHNSIFRFSVVWLQSIYFFSGNYSGTYFFMSHFQSLFTVSCDWKE